VEAKLTGTAKRRWDKESNDFLTAEASTDRPLAAQGILQRHVHLPLSRRHFKCAASKRLGLVQIDSVNVLVAGSLHGRFSRGSVPYPNCNGLG